MKIIHPIEPFYDENSKILILGSFPSVKSREQNFFYGHPQNRFWRVLAAVFEQDTPNGIKEKKAFLKRNAVALWDVIASCEISGSADSSIKNAKPCDIEKILNCADIRRIFLNGRTAEKYYNKYITARVKQEAVCLPSTSPANAAWGLERLTEAWREIKNY